jgi:TPP-dependent pyruvate/acetoin dehydrogenase alpha subunit
MSSAIVGGCLPIAVGVAAGIKRIGEDRKVWCFVGDMAATTGAFHEALQYARGFDLPVTFVIEGNGLSCNSPTTAVWGHDALRGVSYESDHLIRYEYQRAWPHVGTGKFVTFQGF